MLITITMLEFLINLKVIVVFHLCEVIKVDLMVKGVANGPDGFVGKKVKLN